MKVVLLAGGMGTRLREETEFRPKPMVEIGGRPILWHIMKMYAQHGFNEFVICLGYGGSQIKEHFLNYRAMNSDLSINLGNNDLEIHASHQEEPFVVTLVETGLATNTGGRIRRVAEYVRDGAFMVSYGDGVSDLDFTALLAFHRAHGRLATVTATRPPSRFGRLTIDPSGNVREFREKPVLDDWISAGFFVFEPGMLDRIGDDDVLERAPMERVVAEDQLVAYKHEGFFYAMDTYREFLQLNALWDSGDAPWKTWAAQER